MKINLPFNERLNVRISQKSSFLCVGLDPDMKKIPAHVKYEKNPVKVFIEQIIESTKDFAVAYKANLAFYESEGLNGFEALRTISTCLPTDTMLILDGKKGDVGHTAEKYAQALFDNLKADAVTVNPFMGFDSVNPFLQNPAKGAFILALTSNPGSVDFQHLQIGLDPMYIYTAKKAKDWNTNKNCGLVVGATDIEGMQIIRKAVPELPFLVPGVGAQGGSLEEVIRYGRDQSGAGLLINVSRDIIYAGKEKDFAKKVKEKAQYYVTEMRKIMHTSWNYIQ